MQSYLSMNTLLEIFVQKGNAGENPERSRHCERERKSSTPLFSIIEGGKARLVERKPVSQDTLPYECFRVRNTWPEYRINGALQVIIVESLDLFCRCLLRINSISFSLRRFVQVASPFFKTRLQKKSFLSKELYYCCKSGITKFIFLWIYLFSNFTI